MSQILPCFALHDGRAGNLRQAEALALWLSPVSTSLQLDSLAPWRWLAPRRLPGARRAFGSALAALPTDQPCLAIGCGRQAALATRLLRSERVCSIQILDPRIDPRHWDLVVVPAHDNCRGDNVIVMLGSLNAIDDAWLQAHRDSAPASMRSGASLCALLVGGPTTDTPFELSDVMQAIKQIRISMDGELYICTSPRTPAGWLEPIQAIAKREAAQAWTSPKHGANPYASLLACADHIVCTADSVNMLSESCATSAPVEFIPSNGRHGRVADFVTSLVDMQRVRPLGTALSLNTTPLRESARVAAEISRFLGVPLQTPAPTSV